MFTRDPGGGLIQIVDWSRSKGRVCWKGHEHWPDDLHHWYSIDTKPQSMFISFMRVFPQSIVPQLPQKDIGTPCHSFCQNKTSGDPALHTCLNGFECSPTNSKYMFKHSSFCNTYDLCPMVLPQRRKQANILPIYWLFFSWSFDSCLQALEKLLVARRFSHILSASPSQSFGVLGLESNPSMKSSKSSPGSWNIGFAGWGSGMSLHTGIILGFVLLRLQEAAANIFHLSI